MMNKFYFNTLLVVFLLHFAFFLNAQECTQTLTLGGGAIVSVAPDEVLCTPGNSGDITISSFSVNSGGTLIVKSGDVLRFSGTATLNGTIIIETGAGINASGSITMGHGGTTDAIIVLKEKSFVALGGSLYTNKPGLIGDMSSYVVAEGSTVIEICGTFTHGNTGYFIRYVGGEGLKSYLINRSTASGQGPDSYVGDSSNINWIALSAVGNLSPGSANYCGPNAEFSTCPEMWPPGTEDWVKPGESKPTWDQCGFAAEIIDKLPGANNFWVGGAEGKPNDWNEATNWTGGFVPADGADVEFATEENYGEYAVADLYVPSDKVYNVKNLINKSFKALVVPPAAAVVVNEEVVGTETMSLAGKLIIKSAPGQPNGSFIALNMCDKDVYAEVELYGYGRKLTEEELTKKWVDDISGSPTEGVELYSEHTWQHIGIPVEDLEAYPAFYEAWLKKYDETRNGSIYGDKGKPTFYDKWEYVRSFDKLERFAGYSLTQDEPKLYYMRGKLLFCDRELTLTRRAAGVNGASGINEHYGLGQNLFGNSYTAAINVKQGLVFDDMVEEDGESLVEKTVYLYRTGSFQDWGADGEIITEDLAPNAGSYIAIPTQVSTVVWDNQIPSLQGFLLRFTDAETDFGEPDRKVKLVYGNDGVVGNKRPQLTSEAPLSYLSVTLMSASTVDKVWLFSQPGTSDTFDNGWDGFKFFGTPTAFIYSESPAGPMQVNTSSKLDGKVLTIVPNNDKLYTLKLNKSNLEEYADLHLLDLLTGQMVPLSSEETVYNFTATHAGERVKRFVIVNSSDVDPASIGRLDGYLHSNSELVLSNLTTQNGRFYLYDIAGKQMMSSKLLQGVSRINVQLIPGIYMLNMETAGERERVKLIVK